MNSPSLSLCGPFGSGADVDVSQILSQKQELFLLLEKQDQIFTDPDVIFAASPTPFESIANSAIPDDDIPYASIFAGAYSQPCPSEESVLISAVSNLEGFSPSEPTRTTVVAEVPGQTSVLDDAALINALTLPTNFFDMLKPLCPDDDAVHDENHDLFDIIPYDSDLKPLANQPPMVALDIDSFAFLDVHARNLSSPDALLLTSCHHPSSRLQLTLPKLTYVKQAMPLMDSYQAEKNNWCDQRVLPDTQPGNDNILHDTFFSSNDSGSPIFCNGSPLSSFPLEFCNSSTSPNRISSSFYPLFSLEEQRRTSSKKPSLTTHHDSLMAYPTALSPMDNHVLIGQGYHGMDATTSTQFSLTTSSAAGDRMDSDSLYPQQDDGDVMGASNIQDCNWKRARNEAASSESDDSFHLDRRKRPPCNLGSSIFSPSSSKYKSEPSPQTPSPVLKPKAMQSRNSFMLFRSFVAFIQGKVYAEGKQAAIKQPELSEALGKLWSQHHPHNPRLPKNKPNHSGVRCADCIVKSLFVQASKRLEPRDMFIFESVALRHASPSTPSTFEAALDNTAINPSVSSSSSPPSAFSKGDDCLDPMRALDWTEFEAHLHNSHIGQRLVAAMQPLQAFPAGGETRQVMVLLKQLWCEHETEHEKSRRDDITIKMLAPKSMKALWEIMQCVRNDLHLDTHAVP